MPKLDLPLQLSPVFKPKPWGRADLAPLFGSSPRAAKGAPKTSAVVAKKRRATEGSAVSGAKIGEVWLTGDSAEFRTGPVAGLTLAEASREYGSELHGASWTGERFPILAKYLYTSDWLSVQVHPNDDQARQFDPGNLGKCEMWHIIERDDKAVCALGLKAGTDRPALRAACEKAKSRELLNRFRPDPGEAIFVAPGTVHALGPGLILFEAEQNSDLTYRLDDYGRLGLDGKARPLHLDKGLAVTRPELPPRRNLPLLEFPEPFGSRRYLVACPFFAVEEWNLRKLASLQGSPERVEVFSVLSGEGRMETAAGWLGYRPGETWLIPPHIGRYRLVPQPKTRSRLLRFYVPDLNRDFRAPLTKRGVKPEDIRQVVFA
ncbi:MAG TPA: type I phosphomannose isomerase catalytic subunit [Terriglobia bacterium]|nr:type I phosphomannose isomerase catalytic subunit [Terriglobia bacterium]